jgi:hypothetical protein
MICDRCKNEPIRGLPYLRSDHPDHAPPITRETYEKMRDLPRKFERIRNDEICSMCSAEIPIHTITPHDDRTEL